MSYKYSVEIALDSDNQNNPWIYIKVPLYEDMLSHIASVPKNIGMPRYCTRLTKQHIGDKVDVSLVSYISLRELIDIKRFLNITTGIYGAFNCLEDILISELFSRGLIEYTLDIDKLNASTLLALEKIRIIYTREKVNV